jgi:hypothetical protein
VKKIFLAISAISLFLLYVASSLTDWESLSVSLLIYFFLEFVYDMGNRIVIMDFAILLAIFCCLVMPVIFYHEYTRGFKLAALWIKYMPIESDTYFSFAFPSVVALILGLRFPLGRLKISSNPAIYLENAKKRLATDPNLGLKLIAIGAVSGLLDFLSPASLKQIFFLLDNLTYVGAFYVIYSPNKYKKFVIPGVVLVMIAQTIITGMFGEFVYILACSVALMILGKKFSLKLKFLFCFLGICVILILQSIKSDYREKAWASGQSDPAYYAELIADRVINPMTIIDPGKLFFISVRMNQGWLVAVTMDLVPRKFPYADGETIFTSIAAAIVPRFLWEDKPTVGGAENLKRFWGYSIKGYSMNIGPLGEAYGNFGVTGGIVFMFFYGLFFNLVLSVIIKMAEKRPTLILWLPFLFYYAISIETDLLTTMGSLVKGIIFTWLVFKFFKIALRTEL